MLPSYFSSDETDDERRLRFSKNTARSAEARLLDWLEIGNMKPEEIEPFKADIILGSELSYIQNHETLDSLLEIIDKTLSDTGVFYLVQSTDRGTSHLFTQIMQEKYGFKLEIYDVAESVLEFYATGQLIEKYQYYTFSRPNSTFRIMKKTEIEELVEKVKEQSECPGEAAEEVAESAEATISNDLENLVVTN